MTKRASYTLNLVLVLMGIAGALLLGEFAAFPLLASQAPLKLAPFLPERLQFLIQSSKGSMLPKNYVLLVGDSYAQGTGDWLLSTDFNANHAYGSGHLLHSLLRRDVIALARGGHGSIRGLVGYPLSTFELLKRSWRFRLDEPDFVVAYFYEGNDLDDNKREGRKLLPPGAMDSARYQKAFAGVIQDQMRQAVAEAGDFGMFAPFTQLFLNLIIRHPASTSLDDLDRKPGETNRFLIGGSIVDAPDNLQSPAADLNGEDVSSALKVFEASLAYLHGYFFRSRLIVVYLRSPLSLYEPANDVFSAQIYEGARSIFPAEELIRKGDYLAEQVQDISYRVGVEFVDPSPRLKKAARTAPLHGPRDWKHYNRKGYELIAAAIADYIGNSKSLRVTSAASPG